MINRMISRGLAGALALVVTGNAVVQGYGPAEVAGYEADTAVNAVSDQAENVVGAQQGYLGVCASCIQVLVTAIFFWLGGFVAVGCGVSCGLAYAKGAF